MSDNPYTTPTVAYIKCPVCNSEIGFDNHDLINNLTQQIMDLQDEVTMLKQTSAPLKERKTHE